MIVVTGVGVISPLALDARSHFDRLVAGDSAMERLSDAAFRNYPPILQAAVKDFDRRRMIADRMLRKLFAPSPAFALAAASEALQDSGLPARRDDRLRTLRRLGLPRCEPRGVYSRAT